MGFWILYFYIWPWLSFHRLLVRPSHSDLFYSSKCAQIPICGWPENGIFVTSWFLWTIVINSDKVFTSKYWRDTDHHSAKRYLHKGWRGLRGLTITLMCREKSFLTNSGPTLNFWYIKMYIGHFSVTKGGEKVYLLQSTQYIRFIFFLIIILN